MDIKKPRAQRPVFVVCDTCGEGLSIKVTHSSVQAGCKESRPMLNASSSHPPLSLDLSGYVFGGGLEFTGVLFPLQLRLSLNRRESRNTHPRLPRGKDQFQGSQNHIRSFGFSAMLRNQDSANPDLESALIICKQSSVGEG